jgi:hypothetical protein
MWLLKIFQKSYTWQLAAHQDLNIFTQLILVILQKDVLYQNQCVIWSVSSQEKNAKSLLSLFSSFEPNFLWKVELWELVASRVFIRFRWKTWRFVDNYIENQITPSIKGQRHAWRRISGKIGNKQNTSHRIPCYNKVLESFASRSSVFGESQKKTMGGHGGPSALTPCGVGLTLALPFERWEGCKGEQNEK